MSERGEIDLPAAGHARDRVVAALRGSGLADAIAARAAGPFGHTSRSLATLEALLDAGDLGLLAADHLEGLVREDARCEGSFALPRLAPEQRRLIAAFQLVVTADGLARRTRSLGEAPVVEGALEADGLEALLDAGPEPADRLARVFALTKAFLLRDAAAGETRPGEDDTARSATAFFVLLGRAVTALGAGGSLAPLVRALRSRGLVVEGHRYDGLVAREPAGQGSGLLPVRPEHVVGNDEYLAAGLRLARDVAAYDLERRTAPKRLSPILFGLGRPGCGKTVTAHAIGGYFLEHCRARGVPARFVVVRRTDWASSYQNASASNLVRIFRDEVHGFAGVSGVYWPDIDTAFASRASTDLRIEEKQNLAAVFGIFDGTLLPRDGKWFLVCDANTLHMDEATVSRIAGNPFTVRGPTTTEHYVRLMRDIMLADLADKLPADEGAWVRIADKAASLDLSGRTIEAVCAQVRSRVQDFEYPDEYFSAGAEERERIVAGLGRPVDEATVIAVLEQRAAFEEEAAARAEQEAHEREVRSIVRHLNASREAAERAARGLHGGTS